MKNFSIIISTYNKQNSINNTLTAISNCFKNNDEIIIIDDCSNDNTANIIESIIKSYSIPVAFIQNDINTGPAECRNQGVDKAKYNDIIFIDSDIIIPNNFRDNLVKNSNQHPIFYYPHNPTSYYKNPASVYKNTYISFLHSIFNNNHSTFIDSSCFYIKKNIFIEIGKFKNLSSLEDYDLGVRLNNNGYEIFIPDLYVTHQKYYNLKNLIKTNYSRSLQKIILLKEIHNESLVLNNEFKLSFSFIINIILFNILTVYSLFINFNLGFILMFLFLLTINNKNFLLHYISNSNFNLFNLLLIFFILLLDIVIISFSILKYYILKLSNTNFMNYIKY